MNAQEFQDTLEFLAQTPQRVAVLVAGLGTEAQRFRPAPDAFSALEHLAKPVTGRCVAALGQLTEFVIRGIGPIFGQFRFDRR